MYFWSALIAFGAVAFSVQSSSLVIVLTVVLLSAVGLVVLLLPRFTPRVPGWAQAVVPPRYRRGRHVPTDAAERPEQEREREEEAAAKLAETVPPEGGDGSQQAADDREPALAGLHGSTAIGERHRFTRRHRPDDGA